jgi:hypothetical protein
MSTCYMCDETATTDEHAPPKSFFESVQRNNLITVRSCETHNNDNSKDVDYVKNVIVMSNGTNDIARKYFEDKVIRSLTHNNGSLGKRIFSNEFKTNVETDDGIELTAIPIESERFDLIFECIANALYFHDFGERFSGDKWLSFFPNVNSELFLKKSDKSESDTFREEFIREFENFQYEKIDTNNQLAFQYFRYQDSEQIIYKFIFYEFFTVYEVAKF